MSARKLNIWVSAVVAICLLVALMPTSSAKADDGEELWLDLPVAGSVCGAAFGEYNSAGGQAFHNATDYCAPGGTDVLAVASGILVWNDYWPSISRIDNSLGHGITSVLYHPDTGLYTYYAHESETNTDYTLGQVVPRGGVVGYVGQTGYANGNDHLHFGIRTTGPDDETCWDSSCWKDPANYLGIEKTRPIDESEMQTPVAVADIALVEEETYAPRSAEGENPIYDWEQPLAPMWMNLSPTVWWWRHDIYIWATTSGINPNAIATLIQVESCGWPEPAADEESAQGLFQVMPMHYSIGDRIRSIMQGVELNSTLGVNYFKYALDLRDGDVRKAFALYNAGRTGSSGPEIAWPQETKEYVYWASMLQDAFAGAEDSKVLREWLTVDDGRLCNAAAAWQQAHSRDVVADAKLTPQEKEADGHKGITINLPPVGWIVLLYMLGLIIRKWSVKAIGNGVMVVTTIILLVLWFPLPLFHLSQTTSSGTLVPYTNNVFLLREKIEAGGVIVDKIDDILTKAEELKVPVPKEVSEGISKTREAKDHALNFALWISRDPVLTPVAAIISDSVQKWILSDGEELENMRDLQSTLDVGPMFELGTTLAIRLAVGQDGQMSNPWGIHGEVCYSCSDIESWLGTDVRTFEATEFKAPVDGKITKVIINGNEDVGGSSVWVEGLKIRFALIGIIESDAKKWIVGMDVNLGDVIGRRDPNQEYLHIVFEVKNPDGTWADYPISAILLTQDVNYAWFVEKPTPKDGYVPAIENLINNSSQLKLELEVKGK